MGLGAPAPWLVWQGCGYHELDKNNTGTTALRGLDSVDLFESTSANNGVFVGRMEAGEWLSYTIFGQIIFDELCVDLRHGLILLVMCLCIMPSRQTYRALLDA